MNIHFFLDDNCEGTLDPLGNEEIGIEEAYTLAEEMVDSANVGLDNNRKQWNQADWGIVPEKPEQCVPFRYVLSGVYIHCNTQAKNTSGSQLYYFQTNFGINVDSEYNAYIVEYQGSGNGAANGEPGNAFSMEVTDNRGTFNHEMGHLLNLRHSWTTSDGINDTPPISFKYDFNCDGDLSDNWPGGFGSENKTRQCFEIWCNSSYENCPKPMDYTGDDIDDIADPCNRSTPCEAFPCCSWVYVNNNIMSYSRYQDCCFAFTEGQITRALENLSTEEYCKYIEEITDDICLPPMANIHMLNTEFSEGDCSFCFQLSASMHDKYYKLDFFAPSGGLQHSTGWKDGPANRFCISYYFVNPDEYKYGFQPGVEYTAELTVENDCGDEQTEEITFVLPELPENCGQVEPEDKIKIRSLAPNPVSGTTIVEYEAEVPGHLEAWVIPATNTQNQTLIYTEHILSPGILQKNVSTTALQPGVYYLLLSLDGEMDAIQFVKQ